MSSRISPASRQPSAISHQHQLRHGHKRLSISRGAMARVPVSSVLPPPSHPRGSCHCDTYDGSAYRPCPRRPCRCRCRSASTMMLKHTRPCAMHGWLVACMHAGAAGPASHAIEGGTEGRASIGTRPPGFRPVPFDEIGSVSQRRVLAGPGQRLNGRMRFLEMNVNVTMLEAASQRRAGTRRERV
ncbi:hypothetical protein VFPBJ_08035 [Purpureocillium lilacinum]|uniref:Uncharacterized protein n=1 Tax=Purpureocillium lilacinum TaxID=33203 RepID=A0A179GJR0_PURLI|nr:hypothetical protein VFPBJ_08035 [Purpureocillium lilacinum]